MRQRRILCVTVFTLSCLAANAQTEWPIKTTPDLLDLRQEPRSTTDRAHEMFFDQGAWHGYALLLPQMRAQDLLDPSSVHPVRASGLGDDLQLPNSMMQSQGNLSGSPHAISEEPFCPGH